MSNIKTSIEQAIGKPLGQITKDDIKNLLARSGQIVGMIASLTPTKLDDAIAVLLNVAAKDGGIVDAFYELIQSAISATN